MSSLLDLEQLLTPIPGPSPSGQDLRWDTVYADLKKARQGGNRDMLEEEDEDSGPNWPLVIDLSTEALGTQTKDLMLAGWLTEALVHKHGFAGLRDGLRLIIGLLREFWEDVYPQMDGTDLEPRVAPLVWLLEADRGARLPNVVRDAPLTSNPADGCSWNFAKTRHPTPKGASEDDDAYMRRKELAAERTRQFDAASAQTSIPFLANLIETITDGLEALKELGQLLDDRFGSKLAPGTNSMQNSLNECLGLVRSIHKAKGGDVAAAAPGETAQADANGAPAAGGGGVSGPIRTRQQAFQQLAEISAFLRQVEPQSPVPYLIDRAVSWGRLPFEQLMAELIKDETARGAVSELLGIRSTPASSGEE